MSVISIILTVAGGLVFCVIAFVVYAKIDLSKQERRAERLIEAAAAGNTEEVTKWLSRPIRFADHLEQALAAACENGCINTASILIERGAELIPDDLNRTILSGNVAIAELFKKKDALVQIGNLHASILSDELAMVRLICEAGADIDAEVEFDEVQYYEGEELTTGFVERFTPLMMASFRSHTDMVRYLLEQGADPHLVDSNFHRTSLYEAARVNCTEIIELLFKNNVEKETADAFGDTPLMAACICNKTESAELLIENGCSVNTRNNAGDTPLTYAVKFGNEPLIRLLIQKGVNINNKNRKKMTPLAFAKDINTARTLIDHGAAGSIRTILWAKLNVSKEFKMTHEHRTAQGDYDSRFEGKFAYRGVLRHLGRGHFSIGDESPVRVPSKIKLNKAGGVDFGVSNKWGDTDRYTIRPIG